MVDKVKSGIMEHLKTGIQIIIILGTVIYGVSTIISELRANMVQVNLRLDTMEKKLDRLDRLENRCKVYGKVIGEITESCCPVDTTKRVNKLMLED